MSLLRERVAAIQDRNHVAPHGHDDYASRTHAHIKAALPAAVAYEDEANVFNGGTTRFDANAPTTVPVVVRAAAGQSGELTQWLNSAGAILGSMGPDGVFSFKEGVWHKDTTGSLRFFFVGAGPTYIRSGGTTTGTGVIFRDNVDNALGQFDPAVADTETALFVRRNAGGTLSLQRVSMGAVDSAGVGFRTLRVAN